MILVASIITLLIGAGGTAFYYKHAANSALKKAAEEAEISFALGYTDSIHDLAVAQQKANISLQYTVKVTNAVVSAYKELMNMQL